MADIKWYLMRDRLTGWDEIASDEIIAESPDDYDMTNAVEVEFIGLADNYDIDFFRLPDDRIACRDLCGIVQYIGDNLDDATDYFSVGIL